MDCVSCGARLIAEDVSLRGGWCQACYDSVDKDVWRASVERSLSSWAAFDRRIDRYAARQSGSRVAGRPVGREMQGWEMRAPTGGVPECHCYVCLTYKPETEFYNDRSRTNGKQSKCKACTEARRKLRPRPNRRKSQSVSV